MHARAEAALSAVVVIDVQKSFTALPQWKMRNNPKFEAKLEALLTEARRRDVPVIHVTHHGQSAEFRPESGLCVPLAVAEPRAGEPTLVKTSHNAFTTTNLAQTLTRLGRRRLAITGIQTERCCETTARLANDLGYEVDFVTDCTATFPIERAAPSGGTTEVLAADEVVRRTELTLENRFARIVSGEALAAEWAK
jgi:nicotinamidase-related amidase